MRPTITILKFLLISFLTLLTDAIGGVQVLPNDDHEIVVDLEAFQILYTTIKGFACSMDQFRLNAATRYHMISLLGRDANFIDLKLQHTLRSRSNSVSSGSGPIFKNGTKAVFVGRAIYNGTAPSLDSMLNMENLCFLGDNQTAYVDSLRELGCKTLDQIHLMTNAGDVDVVVSSENDDDHEDNVHSGSTAASEPKVSIESQEGDDIDNNESTRESIILIIVITVLVPISLLLLLVMVCIIRQQLRRVDWEAIKSKSKSDKDHTYWRTDHPLAQERLKVIAEFEPEVLERSKCCISTDSSSSDATTDKEQQQQQQQKERRSPRRPRRSKRHVLDSVDDSSIQEEDDDDVVESAEIYSTSSITVHV